MNIKYLIPLFLSLVCVQTLAADGKITINTPANGATVSSNNKVPVGYAAILGKEGDHLHLYVDYNRVDVLREAKGTAELGALTPGKHLICLSINMKSHAPTGVESCVDVISQ